MKDNEFEELNQLQIFLLVLVKSGVASPYDLLKKAGLGAGLTSPVLKRLEQAGALSSSSGPRRRQRYTLTEKGAVWLDAIMKPNQENWMHGRVNSFDSLPRGIILSWLYGGTNEVHQCISRAADDLEFKSKAKRLEAEGLHDVLVRQQAEIVKHNSGLAKNSLIATVYQWLTAESNAKQLHREAEVAKELHELVAPLLSAQAP